MRLDNKLKDQPHLVVSGGELANYIEWFQSSLPKQSYFSGLTGSGYPLEISFTNRSEQVRYTIDPFCYRLPAEQRLQATIDLVSRDFHIDLSASERQWLNQAQATKPAYGAWLGLREKGGTISPKLYIEVDSSIEQREWPEFAGLQPYDRCLTMVGYTPNPDSEDLGEYEIYYRSHNIHPLVFQALLSPLNASQYADKLVSGIEAVYGRKLNDRMPGGSTGFSYTIDSQGRTKSLTLFVFCRSFTGRDKQTRQRFNELIEAQGICPDVYLALTEQSLTNKTAKTQHGIFAITISSQGEITYGVGYCPAERRDNDH